MALQCIARSTSLPSSFRQVMAESADGCMRALLQHCRSARLLPPLCAAAAGDRSARLRQSATEYLLLARRAQPTSAAHYVAPQQWRECYEGPLCN